MSQYLKLFINLCLFRGQAANVPRSETLLVLTALAATITAAISADPNHGLFRGPLMAIGHVLSFALIIYLALRLRGYSERVVQTLTAMFGATTLLQLLVLPFAGWHERLLPAGEPQLILTIPLLFVLVIGLWSLTVMISILRQAMESSAGAAAIIIVGYQFFLFFLLATLATIGSPVP